MAAKKTSADRERQDRVVAEARRYQAQQEQSYRAQALKLYPWICARCGREFSGTKLRELTVHHKDHNHDNNPPDGSNWELLCPTVMRMSTLGSRWRTSTGRQPRARTVSLPRPTDHLLISRTCWSANLSEPSTPLIH
jgi:hypothetical protein